MSPAKREEFFRRLAAAMPDPKSELEYTTPYELLVAVVLSAQATDKSVNLATKKLFPVANTPQKIVKLGVAGLEDYIRTIGLYRGKAKNVVALSQLLLDNHAGQVPRTREELEALPGVGRKTANVVLGNAFDIPGITVDTHFGRLARRFGWTTDLDPVKVEAQVATLIPRKGWTDLSQRMIWHGRRVCHARRPACGACGLARLCPSFGEGPTDPVVAAKLVKPGPFS